MDIVRALDADRGLVCTVGAGGKKTTMYALAARIERAVVTATVRIPIFDESVADVAVTSDPIAAIERANRWPLGVVPAQERDDRYRGYDPETVSAMADAADAVVVKADGARMRRFKAPGNGEPQLPPDADVVLPIASVRVVGKPLTSEYVHRVDSVAELTGLERGETIRPMDVATVLASAHGGHKAVPENATVIPLINMVDDDELESVGREIAAAIHERANVPRVVLAQMTADEPLVAVVE